eukprot:gene7244-7457_t
MSVTGAEAVYQLQDFQVKQDLVDAVAASAYIPNWSGHSPFTKLGNLTVYDGGFTYALPCPPDIFPGLSGPLNISADEWNSYTLQIPPNATLLYEYNQGRKDAAAWVVANNMTEPAAVQRALADTELPVTGANAAFPPPANATGALGANATVPSAAIAGSARQGHRLLAAAGRTVRQGWWNQ